jgi:hypothetical protein
MSWGREPDEMPDVLLRRLRREWPTGWFSPRQAKAKLRELDPLAAAGLLDKIKSTRANNVYYKVIASSEDDGPVEI